MDNPFIAEIFKTAPIGVFWHRFGSATLRN